MRPLLLSIVLTATTARAQFQILPTPTTADLRGIHAVSPEIAWASGTNRTVLRTDDERRIYYELTTAGRAALEAELTRYRGVVAVAGGRFAHGH